MNIENYFDTKGFSSFLKMFILIFILFSLTHYGSLFFFNLVYALDYPTEHIDQEINKIKTARNIKLRAQLQELARLKSSKTILDPYIFSDYEVEDYIPKNGKFVAADLENMKLVLYENGLQIDNMNILSKGQKGSRWETPGGLYEIQTKEENHFSSLGEVYMPYSMQFYGNFFIHGWPYYPDGTLVAPGYSGGCIRLSTESARKVFGFIEPGTKFFIHESSRDNLGTTLKIRNIPKPEVNALSAIVANIETGEVYFKKDADVLRPIASITKLITALVSNETISFGKQVPIKNNPDYAGDYPGNIRSGEVFKAEDLIYPLLMESNNSVAYSLSSYYGTKQFIDLMNKKAKALSMYDSSFKDASGISGENISTAEDLFRLASYLYNKQSFVLDASRIKNKNIVSLGNNRNYSVNNFNIFSKDKNFVGGKTGFTNAAGETMLSVFNTEFNNDKKASIAIIVLGSTQREKDTENLIEWFNLAAMPVDQEIGLLSKETFGFLEDIIKFNTSSVLSSAIKSFFK